MQVAYDGVMLVCNQLGFKRKDRLVREVRAAPEEAEEVMIIEDEEQISMLNDEAEKELPEDVMDGKYKYSGCWLMIHFASVQLYRYEL